MAQRARDMQVPRLEKYHGQIGLQVMTIKTKLNITTALCRSPENQLTKRRSSIQKAWQAFISLNNVWNSSQLKRNLKLRFFEVLLYDCETKKMTKKRQMPRTEQSSTKRAPRKESKEVKALAKWSVRWWLFVDDHLCPVAEWDTDDDEVCYKTEKYY